MSAALWHQARRVTRGRVPQDGPRRRRGCGNGRVAGPLARPPSTEPLVARSSQNQEPWRGPDPFRPGNVGI